MIATHSSPVFSLAKTPINLNTSEKELKFYEPQKALTILNGFSFGFPLYYTGPRHPRDAHNLKSVRDRPEVVRQKIMKEVEAGRVAGPFDTRPLPALRVSPLGLVPKKEPGEYRLIHHLSYPPGKSLNDFIDPKLCSVQYTQFDAAINMVHDLGKGCLLGKSDIKSAFRLLPVSAFDYEQLGFMFDGKFYFDKAMPFGCSIACKTWELFATFLEFCVTRHSKVGNLLHYLDDFLFGGKANSNHCASIMAVFHEQMTLLGVPVSEDKTEGPTTRLVFLGLLIDSEEMVIRIPMEKIKEISQKIDAILSRQKCTLKQMQSLIGSLNFACRAIFPGRPFCRKLIDSICGLTKPHHHLRVTVEIKEDLRLWKEFFKSYNGISVFHDRYWVSSEELQLFTDSAGGQSLGFGAYFAGKWACGQWPGSWINAGITQDITALEFFPIFDAVNIWGKTFKNKKILFHCDNLAVVHIVNSMTSKSVRVMTLLRSFTLLCLKLNIAFKAVHVSGTSNKIADSLSRSLFQKFRQLAPEALPEPTPVPDHLWKIL